MLRSVLNQYGTLFVPYIPKWPSEVCHTNVNAEYNEKEQTKTHGNIKESKTTVYWREVPVCRAAWLPACLSAPQSVTEEGRLPAVTMATAGQ